MLKVNYIITDTDITINYNNQTHIVPRNNKVGNDILDALKSKDFDKISEMVDRKLRIKTFSNSEFEVKNGFVYSKGNKVSDFLGKKIVKFSDEGLPCEPLLAFANKLAKNPSYRAVNELYEFLDKNNHPLTEDGNFIAYKKVREDFYDCHTGTMLNSVGSVLTMPRNEVDEDSSVTCSRGLHVANWNYAYNYQNGLMLEVEVNPEHVCAIPKDYESSKMRVCEYKVLSVVDVPHSLGTELKAKELLFDDLPLNHDYEDIEDDDSEEYEDLEEEEEEEYYEGGFSDQESLNKSCPVTEVRGYCLDCDESPIEDVKEKSPYDQHDFWKW